MELNLPVIFDANKLKRKLKKGMTFWAFGSWDGAPAGFCPDGHIFSHIEEGRMGEEIIFAEKCENCWRDRDYIGDVLSPYHGIVLSKEDAIKVDQDRKEMWDNNPELRASEEKR